MKLRYREQNVFMLINFNVARTSFITTIIYLTFWGVTYTMPFPLEMTYSSLTDGRDGGSHRGGMGEGF